VSDPTCTSIRSCEFCEAKFTVGAVGGASMGAVARAVARAVTRL